MSPYFDVSSSKETNKKSTSRNIRFIQAAISVVKSTHLKPYSCKYSKKTYTQYQRLVLILFKDYRNQHYREFIDDVGDMEGVHSNDDVIPITAIDSLQRNFKTEAGNGIRNSYLKLNFSPGPGYTDIPEPGLFQGTLVKLLRCILTMYQEYLFHLTFILATQVIRHFMIIAVG